MINVLSCGRPLRLWAQISFALTDKRTDRRTGKPSQYRAVHYMQSRVKTARSLCTITQRIFALHHSTDPGYCGCK